ncbi:Uncharacterized protein dnm_086510 [Desulfonema magnum]|uniref:Uncharacterized protein n=1 Tax=Desulfonema magnum TaxID=45655 RepID=A0A975BWH3_9BACT|nr:Uncharacterized protein dnm_086510 [Desulfonema magnum]
MQMLRALRKFRFASFPHSGEPLSETRGVSDTFHLLIMDTKQFNT